MLNKESQPVKSYKNLGLRTASEPIVFPSIITLKGVNNLYATRMVREHPEIEFLKPEVDKFCYFEVKVSGEFISLKADNNRWLSAMYYDGAHPIQPTKDQIDEFSQFKYLVNTNENNEIVLYLQLKTNNYFLKVFQRGEMVRLEAATPTIDKFCAFLVGEPLLKKEIVDIEYNLDEAQQTDVNPLVVLTTAVVNGGTAPITQELNYAYTKTEIGTWNNSAGIEIGVTTSFKAGVPFLADGKIEVSTNLSYEHEWGGSVGTETKFESTTHVNVPAKTKGKANVIVKRAVIDVPFTYTIRRTFLDGKIEDEKVTTGIYKNVECFPVDVETFDFVEIE